MYDIADPLYFDDGERQAYVRLDKAVYDRIRRGPILERPPCALATAV